MEPKDLLVVWNSPDNSRLTKGQISIRLPIYVASRIAALNDMYPVKTKTELITDLLFTAIEQLEDAMPSKKGRLLTEIPKDFFGKPAYEDIGTRGDFLRYAEQHSIQLEKEIGMEQKFRKLFVMTSEDGSYMGCQLISHHEKDEKEVMLLGKGHRNTLGGAAEPSKDKKKKRGK